MEVESKLELLAIFNLDWTVKLWGRNHQHRETCGFTTMNDSDIFLSCSCSCFFRLLNSQAIDGRGCEQTTCPLCMHKRSHFGSRLKNNSVPKTFSHSILFRAPSFTSSDSRLITSRIHCADSRDLGGDGFTDPEPRTPRGQSGPPQGTLSARRCWLTTTARRQPLRPLTFKLREQFQPDSFRVDSGSVPEPAGVVSIVRGRVQCDRWELPLFTSDGARSTGTQDASQCWRRCCSPLWPPCCLARATSFWGWCCASHCLLRSAGAPSFHMAECGCLEPCHVLSTLVQWLGIHSRIFQQPSRSKWQKSERYQTPTCRDRKEEGLRSLGTGACSFGSWFLSARSGWRHDGRHQRVVRGGSCSQRQVLSVQKGAQRTALATVTRVLKLCALWAFRCCTGATHSSGTPRTGWVVGCSPALCSSDPGLIWGGRLDVRSVSGIVRPRNMYFSSNAQPTCHGSRKHAQLHLSRQHAAPPANRPRSPPQGGGGRTAVLGALWRFLLELFSLSTGCSDPGRLLRGVCRASQRTVARHEQKQTRRLNLALAALYHSV